MQKDVKCPVNHIAFIMDGNGRWATKRAMPREFGHKCGADKFKEIVRYCKNKLGIKYITVYAFSTENWKRPEREVNALIKIFRDCILEAESKEQTIRVLFLGNKSSFGQKMSDEMTKLEEQTKNNEYTLCVAMNYGGHAEIVDAVNALIAQGKTHVTEEDITGAICSGAVPPPDMIVRTGGEYRLSNFLLWQSSYSELFFTKTLWPDLSTSEVDELINEFSNRKRRFGNV